jgi:large subunit ribosomal protein L13e
MTKANNAIPKVHQRKHWTPSSNQKGNVKTFLAQPKKAQSRRRLRIQKAKRAFPRPVKALRPSVACPTVRYNFRKRLGRGFSLEEIKAAGISPRYAATIGIRVDLRRKNTSEEGLARNTERLKTYLGKLILFPLSPAKPKPGEATAEQIKSARQDRSRFGKAVAHPASVKADAPKSRKVSKAETEKSAYKFLKKNISAARFMGARIVAAKKKEEKAKAAAEKKAAK